MTISGVSTPGTIAYAQSVSRPAAQPAGDQVSMSLSPETYSSLVSQAGQMPDVRTEVVDAYKSRIQSGAYPTQETVDGLVDRMGGTWAANAQA
jgi:anti-sigma28 factor (negative regulator of flagellin synthesis)